MQIARDAEDANIILMDESLLDKHAKKWLEKKKKKINECRDYETARATMTATGHATRMQAKKRMQAHPRPYIWPDFPDM